MISPAVVVALLLALAIGFSAAENLVVTCGSSIKLQHVATRFRLHSHEVSYSRGSQQQSVTAYPTGDDANSMWIVHGPPNEPCGLGEPLRKGQKLRLQHAATRKWLHSHKFQSPLSSNQEVSAFGSDTESDGADVWAVEWDSKHKQWRQDVKVRIRHVDTAFVLYSHDVKFGQPISGQQEVCCTDKKDKNSEWVAAEGVFMPSNQPAGTKGDEAEL